MLFSAAKFVVIFFYSNDRKQIQGQTRKKKELRQNLEQVSECSLLCEVVLTVRWGGINVDKETASFSVASLINYIH